MCEEFNGWTNRETWAVALYFDNIGDLYKVKKKAVKDLSHLEGDDKLYILSRVLCETIENAVSKSSIFRNYEMAQDIGSLWRVNWREIAEFVNDQEEANA
jgi:hypothetical protein